MSYDDLACPFLRLTDNPKASAAYPTTENICSRTHPASHPSFGYQQTFCLKAFHTTCPVFTKQRVTMPIGFRGTTSRRYSLAWLPWALLFLIGFAAVGIWYIKGFPEIKFPNIQLASIHLPAWFPAEASSTETPTTIPTATIPTATPSPSLTPTRTQTGTRHPGVTTTENIVNPVTPSRTSITIFDTPTFTPIVPPGKQDQTITFGLLANKTVGDPDFDVSATASSGLPVTFTAGGNCSISGNTITITGGGSCTVTASQGGDSNWNPARDVSRTFAISKLNQTINFGGLPDKTFGDPDFGVSASASSGLGVSFSSSGNCSVSGYMVSLTSAGSCSITASQGGDGDYNPAPDVSQSFNITSP
jgi:hypothetical protein